MTHINSIIKEHQQVILLVFVLVIVNLIPILFATDVKNGSPWSALVMEYIYLNSIAIFFLVGFVLPKYGYLDSKLAV